MGELASRFIRERVVVDVKAFILQEYILQDELILTVDLDAISKIGETHLEKES
jgi:hypothetical protein